MRSRLLFAAISLVLASPAAHAQSELEALRARCAEQERQIRQLELDNSRLRGGAAPVQSTKSTAEKSSSEAGASPSTYTVKPGDSLDRIARRSGMTPAALAKANGIKTNAIIHPGQKLKISGSSSSASAASTAAAAPAAATTSSLDGKTYQIRSGDTYSSIARRYKTTPEALIAANPSVKPSQLRVGQSIQLSGRKSPASAPAPAAIAATPKPAAKPSAPAVAAAAPAPAPRPAPTPAPAPVAKAPAPAPAPAPSAPATQTVSNPPASTPAPAPAQEAPAPATASTSEKKFRPITIDGEMTYGDFASKHGTSTERLNSLNGLDLTQNTVLAKGSELYVPAQP